jgi:hypothetical protein
MLVTFKIRIDFTPAPIPGQLMATCVYLNLDGQPLTGDAVPISVGPGKSLTLGPVQLDTALIVQAGDTPRPPTLNPTGGGAGRSVPR